MERIDGIRYVSDTEFYVGETKVTFLEKDIVYIEAVGIQDLNTATLHKKYIYNLIDHTSGKIRLLINLEKSGQNSHSARKVWQEIAENSSVYKTALFGAHPVAKVLASFVIGVMKKKNISFFYSKDEALAWLKE